MTGQLFQMSRGLDEVAVDDAVLTAARAGAWFIFNLSGGKDSGALSVAANRWLDSIGHPRERRLAIHADLGRAEWQTTPGVVERTAAFLDLPLIIVRRKGGDMVARWEARFANGKARYADLLVYNLIGPWSSAMLRFCTSELKAQVIGPELARRLAGQQIVQVIGIRREESTGRKKAAISKPDHRYAKPGNRAGTEMLIWHPGVDWTEEEVFDCHRRHGLELHEAYKVYGSSRLSCAFCVLATLRDHQAAARAVGNVPLYLHLVSMEVESTFSFQPDRWLADAAPTLLPDTLAADVARAKVRAARRREIEANMPPDLRYVAGWPPRLPSMEEAGLIVEARAEILAMHGLPVIYPTAGAVRDRFAELIERKGTA